MSPENTDHGPESQPEDLEEGTRFREGHPLPDTRRHAGLHAAQRKLEGALDELSRFLDPDALARIRGELASGLEPGGPSAAPSPRSTDGNPRPSLADGTPQAFRVELGSSHELPPGHRPTGGIRPFWSYVKDRAHAIGFSRYRTFMDGLLCLDGQKPAGRKLIQAALETPCVDRTPREQLIAHGAYGGHAYKLLRLATECFLMQETGLAPTDRPGPVQNAASAAQAAARRASYATLREQYLVALEGEVENSLLPYFALVREKLREIPLKPDHQLALGSGDCYGILRSRWTNPCLLELIWSYWQEEGMLVQTMNAVTLRFQNRRRASGGRDPLAEVAIDPLRPLNNLLWGYIGGEGQRLNLARRNYEYDHQYGMRLVGKAVPTLRSADSRSRFLESFHNLLKLCSEFYVSHDDHTYSADGFPLLNALRETHLILAEGAHNQFGDLPWTARGEMLVQQWLLARPEMREFLGGRVMVPYPEPWMDRVDSMKKLQGWTDVSVTHFRDLAVTGEQIVLTIRYGSWLDEHVPEVAAQWAIYWRAEIQRYLHAYRAATGVDLTNAVDTTPPGLHLQRRLEQQARQRAG